MKRPISPYIIGALNIALGLLTVFHVLATVRLLHANEDIVRQFEEPTLVDTILTYRAYYVVVIQVASVPILIASGIGLIGFRRWARFTAICFSWYSIVDKVAGAGVLLLIELHESTRLSDSPILMAIGGLLVVATLFNGGTIFFLTRPQVKSAFKRPERPAAKGSEANPFARETDVAHSPVSENPFAPPPRS